MISLGLSLFEWRLQAPSTGSFISSLSGDPVVRTSFDSQRMRQDFIRRI